MFSFLPEKISNKIIILVLSLEICSIGLWGTLTYTGTREEVLQTINNRLSEVAHRTGSEIGKFLDPLAIHSDFLVDHIRNERGSETNLPHIERMLTEFIRIRSEVEEISFVDEEGFEQLRISRVKGYGKEDLRDLSHNPVISATLKGEKHPGDITFSEYFEPQLLVATPLGIVGDNAGSILVTVNLKWLWDVVQTQRVGETGYAYVVNNELKLIGHNDPSLVLSELSLSSTSVPSELFEGTGVKQFLAYENLRGERVAGVSFYDAVNNWWVVVEQPVKEGLAPLRRIVDRFVLVFLIAVPVTITAVLFFSRLTMRPLENFEQGITQIANGKRSVTINVAKNSELASLAVAFNNMAKTLDTQIEELITSERRVKRSEENYRRLNESLQSKVDLATKQLRDTNARLEDAAHNAEQANEAKSLFLANMSHELRTPLNAIIGYSEMLVEDAGATGQTEAIRDLEKIRKAGKHLLGLINDVLDLSKIEAGKMEIYVESIDVNTLLSEIQDTVRPLCEQNANTLVVEITDGISTMNTDVTKLRQCLLNLLSNAVKFTECGTVTLRARKNPVVPKNIQFSVTDTGIGMTPEQLEKVFAAFSQADASTTRRFGGTGLGLAITKGISQMMDGTLSVESTLNIGTTFILDIPQDLDVALIKLRKLLVTETKNTSDISDKGEIRKDRELDVAATE